MPAAAWSAQADFRQLARVGDRKAAKTQGVEQAEDGAVGAHTERKRDDRRGGERAAARQLTKTEADVVPQRLDAGTAAAVSHLCLDRFDLPELQPRGAPGFSRRRALLQVFVDQQVERGVQLVVEVALDAVGMSDVAPQMESLILNR